MQTAYINIAHTVQDPEGAYRAVKAEVQVEPSKEYAGQLQLALVGFNSGKAYFHMTLDDKQVAQLSAALAEFQASKGGS